MTSEKNDVNPDILAMGAEETDPEPSWVEKLAGMLNTTPTRVKRGMLAVIITIVIVVGCEVIGGGPVNPVDVFTRLMQLLITKT